MFLQEVALWGVGEGGREAFWILKGYKKTLNAQYTVHSESMQTPSLSHFNSFFP